MLFNLHRSKYFSFQPYYFLHFLSMIGSGFLPYTELSLHYNAYSILRQLTPSDSPLFLIYQTGYPFCIPCNILHYTFIAQAASCYTASIQTARAEWCNRDSILSKQCDLLIIRPCISDIFRFFGSICFDKDL